MYHEVIMHRRQPLTPEEHRTVRDWSFAMAIVYSLLMVAFLTAVMGVTSPAPPDPNTAATGMQQSASRTMPSPDERPSPTTTATQR
jgi:hypothetical protein